MSFEAKYRGSCAECDDPIFPGNEVEFGSDDLLMHVTCPEELDGLGRPLPICPRCFLAMPVTGVCEECS